MSTETATKLTLDVKTADGKTNGTVDLPAALFDAPANIALMHQVVVAQQAAARQGTHSTKARGEVRGGGAKPYRQKGTGRARQGSTRAPQFAGGGTVHGPQPRDYSQRTPKKMKAAALRGALTDRARNGRVHVLDALVTDGYAEFGRAIATRDDDPATRLRNAGVAYRKFALANPVLYGLMFSAQCTPEIDVAANAFEVLVDTIRYGQVAGVILSADPVEQAMQTWSAVHGAVSLELAHAYHPDVDASANYENVLDFVARALAPRPGD